MSSSMNKPKDLSPSHRTPAALFRRLGRIHHHPVILAVVVFACLVLFGGLLLIFGLQHDAKQLTIVPNQNFIVIVKADGVKRTVPTDADTVGQLLRKLDIKLASGDRVEPAEDAPIVGDNFLVNVYRSVPVAISDGNSTLITQSAAATPRSIAAQAGVQLYGEDRVTAHPTENFVMQRGFGEQVTIVRAKPVTFTLYGQPLSLRTQTGTVRELLKEKAVKLGPKDTVKPALDTPITSDMQVSVVRDGIQVITITEQVAAPVQTVLDTSLSFGSQAVRQEGSPGTVVKTYQINVQHGEEVSRTLVQSVVTVQPVTRIVVKGNTVNIPSDKKAVMAAAGISASDYGYVDYIFSRESHWNAASRSANGRYVGLGQTNPATLSAACPNWQADPVCQTQFFTRYAGRYGGWAGAYNAWLSKGWW